MWRDGHQHPCRGAEAVSLGLDCSENHSDSPVAVHGQGDRRPCCAGGASSTGAVVEETVVGLFLRALHTGAGPGVVST